MLNTPHLEYLQLYDREHAPSRYSVNFTSSLVCAQLKGFDISLLNGVSQVECLVLTGDDMSLHKIIRYLALPTFKNLKTLKLCVGWPSVVDWGFLPILLECTPNLQVLIFPEGLVSLALYKDQFNNSSWQRAESVPECLSIHLKTVEIFNFLGFPVELHLVEYLLECAKVLEKMIIHWFEFSIELRMEDEVDEEDDKVMFELLRSRKSCKTYEVMNLERSSSTCDVIFTD